MRNKFLARFKKPTPLLILGVLSVIFLIAMIIYYLQLGGGAGLGALLYFYLLIMVIGCIAIDGALIKHLKYRTIIVSEVLAILITYIAFQYLNRDNVIDLRNIKHNYLIVIDSKNGVTLNQFKHSWIFDKIYTVENSDVFLLNEKSLDYHSVKFDFPSNGKVIMSKDFYAPKYPLNWTFINLQEDAYQFSDKQIDSIFYEKFAHLQSHLSNLKSH